MYKKASLNLSMDAIVILILAIAILGLGLAFMTDIFSGATGEFKEVGGTAKKQMIEQMESSGKIVELSRPKIELKAGQTKQIFIGLTNQEDTTDFTISSVSSALIDGIVGACDDVVQYKTTPTNILKGDTVVLPINIIAEKTAVCFYELTITYGPVGSEKTTKAELTVDVV